MGSGQKAWAEEVAAEIYQERLAKLQTHTYSKILNNIEAIQDELRRFAESDPSLTRTQWARLDFCLKICKEMI